MEVDEDGNFNFQVANTLAFVVAQNFSRRDYTTLFKTFKVLSREIPSYESLAQEKLNCYPAAEDLTITETSAKIKLQALMNLTSRRLISSLATSSVDANQQLVLTSQWGFDRSSSHSIYHGETHNFMISVVPRRLASNGVTIWKNELPSSLSYCRPVLFKFMNDTKENVQAELALVEAEIEALTPTTLTDGITVTHQMMLMLIDDEYHSITSGTVGSVCQICKATAIKMNPDLESIKSKQANKDLNKYGLSTVHAWIRSMQSLLQVSYKLNIKSWRGYSSESKKQVSKRRKIIQEFLKNDMHLAINSSDQDDVSIYKFRSAKQLCKRTDIFSRLTKLDFELLRQICVILQCISSGRKIIVSKFREFCLDTAKRYMDLYPWYYMPSPLHKLLIHGPDFVENLAIIPIGLLCEEITEDTDIKFWKSRENSEIFHSASCNEKYILRLLLVSDPVLASIQPKVEDSIHKEFYILTGTKQKEVADHPIVRPSVLIDDYEDDDF